MDGGIDINRTEKVLITVLFEGKDIIEMVPIERELFWYDSLKQEMLIFKGGQIVFEYKEDDYLVKMGEEERKQRGISNTYRILPVIKELKIGINKKKFNGEELEGFFKRYLSYNDSNIVITDKQDKGIVFDVPNEEVEDFENELYRNGFKSVVDK